MRGKSDTHGSKIPHTIEKYLKPKKTAHHIDLFKNQIKELVLISVDENLI